MWGASASDVWAVGDDGVLHYDGSIWTVESSEHKRLRAVSGKGGAIWVVGEKGAIFERAGGGWVARAPAGGASDALYLGVAVQSSSDVWITGAAANSGAPPVLHFDGSAFSSLQCKSPDGPTAADATAVVAKGPGEAWLLSGGLWFHATPTECSGDSLGSGKLGSGLALVNGRLWFVGSSGTFGSADAGGTTLNATWLSRGENMMHFNGVFARAPSDVWLGGQWGEVVHWTGGPGFDHSDAPLWNSGDGTRVIFAGSGSDLVVLTEHQVARRQDQQWSAPTTVPCSTLNGAFEDPSGQVMLSLGPAWDCDGGSPTGSAWTWAADAGAPEPLASLADEAPGGVGGDGAGTFWIVGDRLCTCAGKTCNCEQVTVNHLVAVSGFPGGGYAVGAHGTVLAFEGPDAGWKVKGRGTTSADLAGVWAGPNGEAWAAGNDGTIVHFDGTGWRLDASNCSWNLLATHGIAVDGGVEVWAVGQEGTVLRRR